MAKKKKKKRAKKKSARRTTKKKSIPKSPAIYQSGKRAGKVKPGWAKIGGKYVKLPKGVRVTTTGKAKVSTGFAKKLTLLARAGFPGAAVLKKHTSVSRPKK